MIDSLPPIVNTHVHFPPNFSAYPTVDEAVAAGTVQKVRAMGISNFYDQTVYQRFRDVATKVGIVPLFGLEFITVIDSLRDEGIRINDPSNPGRMYLCGKGISPFRTKSEQAAQTAAAIRSGNDHRAEAMVSQLADWCVSCGLDTGLTTAGISSAVAARAEVPVEWVSLQERHIAQAFQETLAALPEDERRVMLEKLYGSPTQVDINDAVALQGEIRSRLLKTGTPGFAPEVPLTFESAYDYILAMGGIPVYPTLGDGSNPVCPFEDTPQELAQRLLERGIYAAELIPIRNTVAVADAYVKAFTEAGLIVMGGTEHNTAEQIPLDPACVDGPLSEDSRQAFWEAACVVAAHQHLVAEGKPGFVDETGALVGDDPVTRRQELIAIGEKLITDPVVN